MVHAPVGDIHQVLPGAGPVGLLVSLGLLLYPGAGYGPWLLLGIAFSTTNLAYAHHAVAYDRSLAGRANTCLNLGVFVGGFGLQWGFRIVVDTARDAGLDAAAALTLAWGLLLALQAASLAWFAFSNGRQAMTPDSALA